MVGGMTVADHASVLVPRRRRAGSRRASFVAAGARIVGAVTLARGRERLVQRRAARRRRHDHARRRQQPPGQRLGPRRPRTPGRDRTERVGRPQRGRPRLHDRRRHPDRHGQRHPVGRGHRRGMPRRRGSGRPRRRVIPPGSLVAGVPAKVRRELTAEERASILRNAEVPRHSRRHAEATEYTA